MTKICADILCAKASRKPQAYRWSVEDFREAFGVQEIGADQVKQSLNSG